MEVITLSDFQLLMQEYVNQACIFIQGHFWHLLMILIMLIRRELRWIGLTIGFVYIMFDDCPKWLWVVLGIIAIITEINRGVDSYHMTDK